MPGPRRSSWPAALPLTVASVLLMSSFVAVSPLRGAVVTAATDGATQYPGVGQPATPTAVGVVNFADLIRQDLLHPPPSVEPVDKPGPDEREPWENPTLGPRRRPGRSGDGPAPLYHPPSTSIGPSPVPQISFEGVRHDRFTPPDTMGAVGLEHVLTVSNYEMQGHTKAGVLLGAVTSFTFWQATNPIGPFDPRTLYDSVNHRFITVALDGGDSDRSAVLVAISETSNLLGGWVMLRFPVCAAAYPCGPTGGEWWADFDQVGLSRNFLSVSFAMFARSGFPASNERRTLVLSYPGLLASTPGQPPPATMFSSPISGPSQGYWGLPVVDPLLTDADLYFLLTFATNNLNRLTGPPDAPAFMIGPTVTYPVFPGGGGPPVPQAPEPGTGAVVTVDGPGQGNAVLRNDHIWHATPRYVPTGSTTGYSAVLWLKVHKNATFEDGGFVEGPDGRYYIYPSIAVNRYDDVLIGFTQTSSTEYLSAGYAFRAGTDPAGAMRDAHVYKPGEGHFNLPSRSGRNRWGDYSHTVVDPSDDTTLWTIQEYARPQDGIGPGSGRWGTRWAAVNARGLQPPGAARTLQASSAGSSVQLAWAAPTDGGAPTAYWIEAGSAPSLANLANFSTGNVATSFSASGVSDGTYYARVKGSNGAGVGPPSNEVQLVVGCVGAPDPPGTLSITQNSGGTVTLTWSGSSGGATSYVLEAGSAPGLANLVSLDLGRLDVSFTATGVLAGTYYVRVRGRNRCGTGATSNEVVVVVP